MIIGLYYLLVLFSILLTAGALLGKNHIFAIFSTISFFCLAIASMGIEVLECGATCTTVTRSDYGIAALFLGMGMFMLYTTVQGYITADMHSPDMKVKW